MRTDCLMKNLAKVLCGMVVFSAVSPMSGCSMCDFTYADFVFESVKAFLNSFSAHQQALSGLLDPDYKDEKCSVSLESAGQSVEYSVVKLLLPFCKVVPFFPPLPTDINQFPLEKRQEMQEFCDKYLNQPCDVSYFKIPLSLLRLLSSCKNYQEEKEKFGDLLKKYAQFPSVDLSYPLCVRRHSIRFTRRFYYPDFGKDVSEISDSFSAYICVLTSFCDDSCSFYVEELGGEAGGLIVTEIGREIESIAKTFDGFKSDLNFVSKVLSDG